MARWQAIVFDLDDTLYPERDFVLSGFRAVARWAASRLGIPADAGYGELRGLLDEGVRGSTFNEWLSRRGIATDEWVPEMIEVYRTHIPDIEPFENVPGILARLRAARYCLGLLSDGYLDVQRRKLEALGLEPAFDAVVFSDEWGRSAWKPSTKPFEAVLERLGGAHPAGAVYVGDNPSKDFLGARNAGMFSIRVRTLEALYGSLEPESPRHAPDLEIPGLDGLEQALRKLEDAACNGLAFERYNDLQARMP